GAMSVAGRGGGAQGGAYVHMEPAGFEAGGIAQDGVAGGRTQALMFELAANFAPQALQLPRQATADGGLMHAQQAGDLVEGVAINKVEAQQQAHVGGESHQGGGDGGG